MYLYRRFSMLNKASEYAIKAMIYLATHQDHQRYIRIPEVAEAINSPAAFTSKILQQLRSNGLVLSAKGAKGGFKINAEKKISLLQIVQSLEGKEVFTRCILGLDECSSSKPCPVHEQYKSVKAQLLEIMTRSYIDDYIPEVVSRAMNLK